MNFKFYRDFKRLKWNVGESFFCFRLEVSDNFCFRFQVSGFKFASPVRAKTLGSVLTQS